MRKLHKIIGLLSTAVMTAVIPFCTVFATGGVVNVDTLNVRTGPGTGYGIAGQLSGGTAVEVVDSKNGWYTIGYNSGLSYVDGRFVTLNYEDSNLAQYFDPYMYGRVTASELNIRDGASIYSNVVGKAGKGAAIEILGKKNGFVIVKHNGNEAFMSESYIEYILKADYDSYYAALAAQAQAAPAAASSSGNSAVNIAMQYVGVPYVYGGSSPSGFDCSGFTSYVYRQLGYSLNRTAAGQASNGTVVASKSELVPGDLVLFRSYSGSEIGHVGIYVGNGNMIHSPKPGSSVCVVSINSDYYASRYVGARRIC